MTDAQLGLLAVGGILVVLCLVTQGLKRTLIAWGIALALVGWPLRTQLRGVTASGNARWTGVAIIIAGLGTCIVFVLPERVGKS